MTNIIKKMKNVNTLSLFTKLVGLAVVFNLAACGCGKSVDAAKPKLTVTTADGKELKVTITSEETFKLDDVNLKLVSVEVYSDRDCSNPLSGDVNKITVKENLAQSLKKLSGKDEVTKEAPFEIKLNTDYGDKSATVKSYKAKFSLIDGKGNEVTGAKNVEVKWQEPKPTA
jgi:hypothetical protein